MTLVCCGSNGFVKNPSHGSYLDQTLCNYIPDYLNQVRQNNFKDTFRVYISYPSYLNCFLHPWNFGQNTFPAVWRVPLTQHPIIYWAGFESLDNIYDIFVSLFPSNLRQPVRNRHVNNGKSYSIHYHRSVTHLSFFNYM